MITYHEKMDIVIARTEILSSMLYEYKRLTKQNTVGPHGIAKRVKW